MLLFSCARWEDHRRLSGVCETFSRSIPMTPRRYRSSPSQMSLRPVILPRKGLYQQRKRLTEQPTDINQLSALITNLPTFRQHFDLPGGTEDLSVEELIPRSAIKLSATTAGNHVR